MAQNIPKEEEWQKVYPKRVPKKKTFFDEKTYEDNNGNINRKSTTEKDNRDRKCSKSGKNNEKITCKKCNLVCKNQIDLEKHQTTCLVMGEKESFLKYHSKESVNPVVVIEKMVIPPSQSSQAEEALMVQHQDKEEREMNQQNLGENTAKIQTQTKASYAAVTGAGPNNQNIAKKPKSASSVKSKEPSNSQTITQPAAVMEPVSMSSVQLIENIYGEVTQWRRNLFKVPKGNLGKKYVNEMTRLLNRWSSTNEEEALKLLMIMPNILLQRSSKKSKARENKNHLLRRFELWEKNEYEKLLEEGKCIQQRLKTEDQRKNENWIRQFRNHMMMGRVNPALRLLEKNNSKGVLPISPETIKQLYEKHPAGEPLHEEMMLEGPIQEIHPVIFDDMSPELVRKVAAKMTGAAGPSGFDSDDWKNVLLSRSYGSSSVDLCEAVATAAKALCTENRTEVENGGISAYLACRLIPLDKDPGLRPIGIGEVLRRIVGKMVVFLLKPELQKDAGDLQMCVGQQGGCEAGVHAMVDIFQEENTHGIIQVDANNAFNTINRNVFLHNIQIICPEISTYIRNCYLKPARLFVVGGIEIKSEEGTTQGDTTAMPAYALGIAPLLVCLAEPIDERADVMLNSDSPPRLAEKARLAAYADDLTGSGTIDALKVWWDLVVYYGPFIGYYAKPSKSWLIVKPEHKEYAEQVFAGTGLQITTQGQRHLGAVIGSEEYKDDYVTKQVEKWIGELEMLGEVAKIDPHVAYCAYVFGLQHRYTYLLRTIPNISEKLKKLDTAIDEHVVGHLLNNHAYSDMDRKWFSLPPRLGGLGINILSEISDIYYQNSRRMTAGLVKKIVNQHEEVVLSEENSNSDISVVAEIKDEKRKREEEKVELVKQHLSPQKLKVYEGITEKGASNWLNALPLKEHNFYLDKQMFWDSIFLRYGISLPRLPARCVCDSNVNFSVEHALSCKKGGFVNIRHNEVRDFTAELLSEICNDVAVEPLLTPLTGEKFTYKTANTDDHARLDVSARGVWIKGSRAFFDIRVFNPLAPSYSKQTLKAAHRSNENSKKQEYAERVLNVEHGSFTPLVFSCLGGMSTECNHFYNRIADKLSEKRDINTSKGRTWVRTKLSFSLLRSTNLCIRGSRTKQQYMYETVGETDIQVAMINAKLS